ncbi:MAG TPA: lytic transglycosylase domain-containing protein [Beijerinckiaceae bacterium]|jgi:hypothetical protein
MFLFTTPPTRESALAANPVVDAVRYGAEKTGTSFDYLLATAQRESGLNAQAKAPTSSATGLFQFIEQTWLGMVKQEGPKLGLADQAAAIAARSDGTYAVADPQARQAILGLREDPKVASVVAGAFTQKNREALAAELGREPTAGDLYVAHFLGARGASGLIRAAQSNPSRAAASDFPDAAAANRSIFYDRSGRARGAGEVYAALAQAYAAQGTPVTAAANIPVANGRPELPGLQGLFLTDSRRGPMSDAVAKIWRRPDPGARVQTASLGGYFPRSETAVEPAAASPTATTETAAPTTAAPLAADAPANAPANAPLPPPRPAEFGGAPSRAARGRPGPLDLGAFMKWRRA